MDGYSQTPKEERIKVLSKLIPEVFADGKIDFERLRAILGDDVNLSNEWYVLNWAGKGDAFRKLQEASGSTLVPCPDESVDFDATQNLFIEGDNFDALKALQRSYFGKVKTIYIDPPYNTGKDSFVYSDKFSDSKENYLKKIGDMDEKGNVLRSDYFHENSKANGFYHSNWLSMMMTRLYLAKDLLSEDGLIFVSIDDNEVHNLALLMNEIFGEDNYVNEFCWVNNLKGRQISAGGSVKTYERILCYAKDCENIGFFYGKVAELKDIMPGAYKGKEYEVMHDERGEYVLKNELHNTNSAFNEISRPNLVFCIHYNKELNQVKFSDPKNNVEYEGFVKILPKINNDGEHKYHAWRWKRETIEKDIHDLEFIPHNGTYKIYTKVRKTGITRVKDIITDIGNGKAEVDKLFGVTGCFSNPKSTTLLGLLLSCVDDKDGIVLDFFAGSATTAHAVMKLNAEDGGHRKFIMVQLDEECEEKIKGLDNICKIGEERLRLARAEILEELKKKNKDIPDLGFKIFKLGKSNFKKWQGIKASNKEAWEKQLLDHIETRIDGTSDVNIIYELLLKNGKDLNSTIERKNGYYAINGKELIIVLDSINRAIIDDIISLGPGKVIILEGLFAGNNSLKTDTDKQMQDARISFEAV